MIIIIIPKVQVLSRSPPGRTGLGPVYAQGVESAGPACLCFHWLSATPYSKYDLNLPYPISQYVIWSYPLSGVRFNRQNLLG